MNKENKRRIRNILVFALITLFLVVGISYAYISFSVEGTKTNLIKAGCLKFDFTETAGLSLGNSSPMGDKSGLATSPYSFTITNVCSSSAYYETKLNLLSNSNVENVSKVKVALGGDANVLPTLVSNLKQVELEEAQRDVLSTYLLDTGYLGVDESKTFDLRMWIDYDATSFDGLFSSKIIIEAIAKEGPSYSSSTAGYKVLENNTILDTNPNFVNLDSNENGLFIYPTSQSNPIYYFRGNVTNNYIKFGKYSEDVSVSYIVDASGKTNTITHKKGEDIIWRIVRINDDASITIVLNEVIGILAYNHADTQNALIYNDSTNLIKPINDAWYQKHLSSYSKYIVDNGFCGDATLEEDGKYYKGYTRNITNGTPSLVCSSDNLYTVANGKLTNPIGLLTADELTLSGASYNRRGNDAYTTYLYDMSGGFYTMTPGYFENQAYIIGADYINGLSITTLSTHDTRSGGIRPVIHLSSDVILSGDGTINNKYTVEGLYSEGIEPIVDKQAPVITSLYASNEWSRENKKITITVSDDEGGSGIAAYYISTSDVLPSVDASGWITATENRFETSGTYDNGLYYVYVKDKSGNISDVKSITVTKVDKVAPTCSITIDSDGAQSITKILTINTTEENLASPGYSWDGIEYTAISEQIVAANNVYTAYVKDMAGNTGTCSVTVTSIRNDFNAPYITSVKMVNNNDNTNLAKAGDTATLIFTISEEVVIEPIVSVNGATLTTKKSVNADGTVTYTASIPVASDTPIGGINLKISDYKDDENNVGPTYSSSKLLTVYKLSD